MLATALSIILVSAVAGQQVVELKGNVVSRDVKVISGKLYVSLADIARAMGLQVVKSSGGYKLVAAGGANQMASNAQGKIGDDLFTGGWRFKVTGFKAVDTYMPIHL